MRLNTGKEKRKRLIVEASKAEPARGQHHEHTRLTSARARAPRPEYSCHFYDTAPPPPKELSYFSFSFSRSLTVYLLISGPTSPRGARVIFEPRLLQSQAPEQRSSITKWARVVCVSRGACENFPEDVWAEIDSRESRERELQASTK